MIGLKRTHSPIVLTPDFVSSQTRTFKVTGESVWNIEEVKKVLLELSFNKCAYCECNVTEESKYLEVEHFEDKSNHPDKVLDWDNLLPSCKRCNGSKGAHNVNYEPIINPFKEDPKEHLKLHLYRFKGKTEIGKTTIDVVNLNNSARAVLKRFEIGEELQNSVDLAFERLEAYKANRITQRKNKLLTIVEELLKLCQPESIYAATCSTVLHHNDVYQQIVNELKTFDLWSDNFEKLHCRSRGIMLETQ
ncbi:HNH endonuclease [Pontibacter diazotrophicus]|uniref:HNH endonuclease n=1 Tax=Pontibacter diazotrophicus TaxID=1400979 RepID=A0A3D8LEL0_9BACT|nr:HNH endonuclease [Pontibacter diazotrophicus]RDV15845.1 HNH endonuclease [Pontibacter diazotrophicus]